MSKRNYYRPNQETKTENLTSDEVVTEETEEVAEAIEAEETPIEETTTIEEESEVSEVSEMTYGKVVNCSFLNVRTEPTKESEPVCIIKEGDIVEIKKSESSDDWYKVITVAGAEGYCMTQYILEQE